MAVLKTSSLRSFAASACGLEEIPIAGSMPDLEMIQMRNNEISAIPEALPGWTPSIQHVNLQNNAFSALPNALHNWAALTIMDVSFNSLTTLPDSITRCCCLEELYVNNNRLASLPEAIGRISKLRVIYAHNNDITALPDSICTLQLLEQLWIKSCSIKALPADLGKLSNLVELNAGINFKITSLPTSMAKLSKLKVLNIRSMKLGALPSWIGTLASLDVLQIANMGLETLPEELGALGKLRELHANNNKLKSLPPKFKGMKSLEYISFAYNEIDKLPIDLIMSWSKLHTAHWNNNQITELPPKLGKHPKLALINPRHNPYTWPEKNWVARIPTYKLMNFLKGAKAGDPSPSGALKSTVTSSPIPDTSVYGGDETPDASAYASKNMNIDDGWEDGLVVVADGSSDEEGTESKSSKKDKKKFKAIKKGHANPPSDPRMSSVPAGARPPRAPSAVSAKKNQIPLEDLLAQLEDDEGDGDNSDNSRTRLGLPKRNWGSGSIHSDSWTADPLVKRAAETVEKLPATSEARRASVSRVRRSSNASKGKKGHSVDKVKARRASAATKRKGSKLAAEFFSPDDVKDVDGDKKTKKRSGSKLKKI